MPALSTQRRGFTAPKTIRRRLSLLPLLALFFALSLSGWPVDMLTVRQLPSRAGQPVASPWAQGDGGGGPLLFAAPAPLGQEYWLSYIHSVQLTPVHDRYRVQNTTIWSWQERIQSHNAGLPSVPPRFGRFWHDPPWMIVEGGRQRLAPITVRVGTAGLGRNEFLFPPLPAHHRKEPGGTTGWTPLFKKFPGQRLLFSVERIPLFMVLTINQLY